jgi:hypothetical protein
MELTHCISKRGQPIRSGPSPRVLGEVLKPPVLKNVSGYETFVKTSDPVRLNLLGYGQAVGSCECGNEPSDSIKCGEIFY